MSDDVEPAEADRDPAANDPAETPATAVTTKPAKPDAAPNPDDTDTDTSDEKAEAAAGPEGSATKAAKSDGPDAGTSDEKAEAAEAGGPKAASADGSDVGVSGGKAGDATAGDAKDSKPDAKEPDAKDSKPDAKDSDSKPDVEDSDAKDSEPGAKEPDAEDPGSGSETGCVGEVGKAGGGAAAKGGRKWGVRGAWGRAGVGLLLVAAVATAGLQWYRADRAAQEEAARQAVERQAGEFGQALLSYDHEHLQDARNRVLSLASEDFAKTYDVAFTGGLEGVITKLKADASATVRAVYLGDVDESTARAIVVMDSEVRSSAGTRRVLGSHLDMRLVRKDGTWRVTEVTSIGAAQETMTDPDGRQQGGEAVVPTPGASPAG